MPHADLVAAKGSREESLEFLVLGLEGMLCANWAANLANASSMLWYHYEAQGKRVNWAGTYIGTTRLDLGPFMGKPACQEIEVGKGVCGAAAATGKPQLVANVHEFPGHIACDGDTLSELVVPVLFEGAVVGVLDFDSIDLDTFDQVDVEFVTRVAEILAPSFAAALKGQPVGL